MACNKGGALEADQPMQSNALNEKLSKLCVSIGILARNTYYSLRRSAIIETRRKHGTEAAKDLALHKPDGHSLLFYDNVGMGDVDMTSMRMDTEAGMSRDQIRDFFAQYRSRVQMPSDSDDVFDKANVKTAIDNEVKHRLKGNEDYIQTETSHATLLEEATQKLLDMQDAGGVSDTVMIPVGYSAQKGAKLIELLTKYGEGELAKRVNDGVYQRKLLHKRVRHQLQKEIRERMEKEQLALVKKNTASAKQVTNIKGGEPRNVKAAGAVDLGDSTDAAIEAIRATADEGEGAEGEHEDADVDEEVLEEQETTANARQEPEAWQE